METQTDNEEKNSNDNKFIKQGICKGSQTNLLDYIEELSYYIKNKKLLFKPEILKVTKIIDEKFLNNKNTIKKPQIKLVKPTRFETNELRLIHSYNTTNTSFCIKSINTI